MKAGELVTDVRAASEHTMKKARIYLFNGIVLFFVVALPVLFALKVYCGISVPLIAAKDKTLLYSLVVMWNACFSYFILKVL
jgi:hypothetical protein